MGIVVSGKEDKFGVFFKVRDMGKALYIGLVEYPLRIETKKGTSVDSDGFGSVTILLGCIFVLVVGVKYGNTVLLNRRWAETYIFPNEGSRHQNSL